MRQLLRGGLIFDGNRVLKTGHALLIEDDHILDLSPEATFDGFQGATLDLSGHTVLPGLIDCHVHLCLSAEADVVADVAKLHPAGAALRALGNAQRALKGGVTTMRDLGGFEYAEIAVRDAIANRRVVGPTLVCAGKMICMTGGHGWFIGIEADNSGELVRAVRSNIKAGADCIKFMATGGVLTPGIDPLQAHFTAVEIGTIVSEAARLGRSTAVHATGAVGISQAVRAGVTSVEHGFELTDEIIEDMLERGTYLVPTLSAMGVVRRRGLNDLPAYVAERVARLSDLHRESIRSFYRAGGKIAMGTDAGTPFNPHGANAGELEFMVEVGVAPHDALLAATAQAANLLGLSDRGEIRAGARADLLVVRGSPLEDIRCASDATNHRCVFRAGEPINSCAPATSVQTQAAAMINDVSSLLCCRSH